MLFLDSQLITLGDTQVSIFNYDNGDLLISWDLMKSYGINLATITFEEVGTFEYNQEEYPPIKNNNNKKSISIFRIIYSWCICLMEKMYIPNV